MSKQDLGVNVRSYFCSLLGGGILGRVELGRAEAYFWASVGHDCIVYDTEVLNGFINRTEKYYLSCKPLVQLNLGNQLNGERR